MKETVDLLLYVGFENDILDRRRRVGYLNKKMTNF